MRIWMRRIECRGEERLACDRSLDRNPRTFMKGQTVCSQGPGEPSQVRRHRNELLQMSGGLPPKSSLEM